jgi:hypothetical protein
MTPFADPGIPSRGPTPSCASHLLPSSVHYMGLFLDCELSTQEGKRMGPQRQAVRTVTGPVSHARMLAAKTKAPAA